MFWNQMKTEHVHLFFRLCSKEELSLKRIIKCIAAKLVITHTNEQNRSICIQVSNLWKKTGTNTIKCNVCNKSIQDKISEWHLKSKTS